MSLLDAPASAAPRIEKKRLRPRDVADAILAAMKAHGQPAHLAGHATRFVQSHYVDRAAREKYGDALHGSAPFFGASQHALGAVLPGLPSERVTTCAFMASECGGVHLIQMGSREAAR